MKVIQLRCCLALLQGRAGLGCLCWTPTSTMCHLERCSRVESQTCSLLVALSAWTSFTFEPCLLQEHHQHTELASALQGQLSTVKASLTAKDKAHRDERAALLRRVEDLEGQVGNLKVRPSLLFKSPRTVRRQEACSLASRSSSRILYLSVSCSGYQTSATWA